MLEKDIENLIALYPNQFIKGYELTLKEQQAQLSSYTADIILEDKTGTLLIVETKLGILTREKLIQATGQVIQYYGLVKKEEPLRKIQMVVVANIIPEGMTEFFTEKYEIKFIELSAHELATFAERVGYHFVDSREPAKLVRNKLIIKKLDISPDIAQKRVWIFQANPHRYDVLSALADDSFEDDVWLVSRYKNQIHSDDIGIIWMSGEEGGIYAIVDVTSDPQMMRDSEQSSKFWVDDSDKDQLRRRVKIHYRLKLTAYPLLKEELKKSPILRNMEIFRIPRGTNFSVSSDEWKAILGLLESRRDNT